MPSSPDRPRGWGPPERGAVGRLDAWGLSGLGGGRCDLPASAYSPLGPVAAMRASIDHCYARWISGVQGRGKRAPDTSLLCNAPPRTRHARRYTPARSSAAGIQGCVDPTSARGSSSATRSQPADELDDEIPSVNVPYGRSAGSTVRAPQPRSCGGGRQYGGIGRRYEDWRPCYRRMGHWPANW